MAHSSPPHGISHFCPIISPPQGAAISKNLIADGYDLSIYNRSNSDRCERAPLTPRKPARKPKDRIRPLPKKRQSSLGRAGLVGRPHPGGAVRWWGCIQLAVASRLHLGQPLLRRATPASPRYEVLHALRALLPPPAGLAKDRKS